MYLTASQPFYLVLKPGFDAREKTFLVLGFFCPRVSLLSGFETPLWHLLSPLGNFALTNSLIYFTCMANYKAIRNIRVLS